MEPATITRLNRIAHELRRPLQTLALTFDPGTSRGATARACIDQTRLALADLDDAINGRPTTPEPAPVRLRAITGALSRRWEAADVEVLRPTPAADATVLADPGRLGAALDNLIANGLAHGTGPVRVRASHASGEALIEVRDGGPTGGARRSPDPRHGHGLQIAAEAAEGCGGRLIGPLPVDGGGTLAAIAVPTLQLEPHG